MPSSNPTDELLAALPDVGLRLWMLSQIDEKQWSAALYHHTDPIRGRWEAEGITASAALIAALKLAGVDVTDDSP